jgi:hypothetical protein
MIKILFLAANPSDSTRLRLDEESRGIDQVLRQAEFRDRFEIAQHWAVRVADLQGLLLRHRPDIVHFSGHGSKSNEIVLADNSGDSHPVSVRALSRLFSVLKDDIRCVVLNACYSEPQAQAIAQHIECVIGMSRAIGDQAAISFSTSFYQALGYGKDVKTAFELGCVQIDLENLGEQDTPKLLTLRSNPSSIVFAQAGPDTHRGARDDKACSTKPAQQRSPGRLLWYLHDGRHDGAQSWSGPKVVGTSDWHQFKFVFSGGEGIIYTVNPKGQLLWYRHDGRHDGAQSWSGPKVVGTSDWHQFKFVFSDGEGTIYAVNPKGQLLWYRHDGRLDGSQSWSGPKVVGTSDWHQFKFVFSDGEGIVYAVTH